VLAPVSFAILLSLEIVLAANGADEGRNSRAIAEPNHPVSALSSAYITVTADGFDPAVITVAVNTEVARLFAGARSLTMAGGNRAPEGGVRVFLLVLQIGQIGGEVGGGDVG
jgi:hypothetical protein